MLNYFDYVLHITVPASTFTFRLILHFNTTLNPTIRLCVGVKKRIKERASLFPFSYQSAINIIIPIHVIASVPMHRFGSLPSTGICIKKIFGNLLQSIKFIIIWFSTAPNTTNINEVTISIDDTTQIEVKRQLLLHRNSI